MFIGGVTRITLRYPPLYRLTSRGAELFPLGRLLAAAWRTTVKISKRWSGCEQDHVAPCRGVFTVRIINNAAVIEIGKFRDSDGYAMMRGFFIPVWWGCRLAYHAILLPQ